MGTLIKFAIVSSVIVAVLTVATALIPAPFTSGINDSIVYFLSTIGSLNFLFNVSTFFLCLRIVLNTFIGCTLLILSFELVQMLSQ